MLPKSSGSFWIHQRVIRRCVGALHRACGSQSPKNVTMIITHKTPDRLSRHYNNMHIFVLVVICVTQRVERVRPRELKNLIDMVLWDFLLKTMLCAPAVAARLIPDETLVLEINLNNNFLPLCAPSVAMPPPCIISQIRTWRNDRLTFWIYYIIHRCGKHLSFSIQ